MHIHDASSVQYIRFTLPDGKYLQPSKRVIGMIIRQQKKEEAMGRNAEGSGFQQRKLPGIDAVLFDLIIHDAVTGLKLARSLKHVALGTLQRVRQ